MVTTRGDVHYVVTEYGVAYLHGKSLRERAVALIQIAHPRFREELDAAAKANKILFSDQIIPEGAIYPVEMEHIHEVNGTGTFRQTCESQRRTTFPGIFIQVIGTLCLLALFLGPKRFPTRNCAGNGRRRLRGKSGHRLHAGNFRHIPNYSSRSLDAGLQR